MFFFKIHVFYNLSKYFPQPGVTPMFTPTMTPGSTYQGMINTPIAALGTTPSYNPTNRAPMPGAGPGVAWPGATPRTPAPVSRTPRANPNPIQQAIGSHYSAPSSSGDMDWAKAAEMWANRSNKKKSPRASPHPSPARSRTGESPFAGSNQGDGTPLIDER